MRRSTRLLAIALAVCLLATAATAAPSRVTIDADHQLTSDAAIETYESEGITSANLTQLDLGITVAKSHGQADIDGFRVDLGETYLCLNYREGLAREVRIYLPSAYFEPRPATLSPLGDGPEATFEPVKNRTMTAVTATFTEPTRACYAVSSVSGGWFGIKGWVGSLVGNVTGFELPSLGGSAGEWQYLDGGTLAGNDTVTLPLNASDPTVQYDQDPIEGTESWVTVPGCSDPADQAVCRFQRHNDTLLMSTQSNPPTVRYRAGSGGPLVDLDAAWNSFQGALDGMTDWVAGLFGGG